METELVQRIDDGLAMVDVQFQGRPHAIGTWLLKGERGWVMIDCGPTPTRHHVVAGVQALGLEMGDVERIVLTHVHLDHSAAASVLMREYPHLRLAVQRDAAPFMVDPTRLWRSATMSFGEQMDRLWGEVTDIDPTRVDTFVDGDTVPGTSLSAHATPGHTGTHVAFFDPTRQLLFSGDAALARIPGSSVIIPTLAPTDFDPDAWAVATQTMQALRPQALALPHCGYYPDADAHLDQVMERIHHRVDMSASILNSPEDLDALIAAYADDTRRAFSSEGGDVDGKIAGMELATPSYLGGQALLRWSKVNNLLKA